MKDIMTADQSPARNGIAHSQCSWAPYALASVRSRSSGASRRRRRPLQRSPCRIRVDAGKPTGPLKPIWRFFGADEPNYAYMKDGQKLLAELGAARAEAGLLPRAQPAHHRRRHARRSSGASTNAYTRGRAAASRSTTGRSSTASSTPTSSAA